MSSPSPSAPLLANLRFPSPILQRHAVISLFQKLTPSLSSDDARHAISVCLSSSSPAVADQTVRELCRLALSDHHHLLLLVLSDLQSALESCDPPFVSLFVKGIGLLCHSAFRNDEGWGRRFDPVELHPFIKVLSCRQEVEAELIQQVLLFIVHNRTAGMEAVKSFLRPFLLFSVIRKPLSISSSMFARDLVSSIASLACSFPSEAIGIIKLLTECLKHFPCSNEMEFRYLVVSAEYIVDAYLVVLKHIVASEMQLAGAAQACSIDVLDVLFSLHAYMQRPYGGIETVIELSKHLLATQKELGLQYMPEFAAAMASISVILSLLEFEHEQLSILKFLIFLFQWRAENEYHVRGVAYYLSEELLFIFPVLSLVSSPSKSVKAAAAFLLSVIEKIISGLLNDPVKNMIPENEVLHISDPKSIPFRLLHHLWFQDKSHFAQSTYLRLICSTVSEGGEAYCEANYWTCQLKTYFSSVRRLKVISLHQSSENLLAGIHLLLSSVASVLIMHPMLGSSAIDSLAAIGLVDPIMGMPLFQAILFFNKLLSSQGCDSPEMLIKLLEMITSLASHSVMIPLIVQMLLPMLQKDAKPMLHAAAIRLLCKTWIVTDKVFGTLQEVLDPKAVSDFISEREICISIAGSVRDVCRHNPDRGVDLILSVSSCIEREDSILQALGFESLAYLCEADVVDFYTAWDVIAKHMMDYTVDPIVSYGLCTLLRWGATDAAAYPERSKTVVQILWEVATVRNSCSSSSWVKARVCAFKSLSHYEVDQLQETFPDFKDHILQSLVTEENAEVLMAMEELEMKIINFEHINRRRVHKEKRAMVHKVEKLLDVFPQVMFSQGNYKFRASELPGAALLSFVFTPKDIQGTSKGLAKLHSAYEKALLEISESLHVSRNILVAHLALQSWKVFFHRWIREAATYGKAKESSSLAEKITTNANDIFKILCKAATEAIPRIAVNIALAIGAFCSVLPPITHIVITAASNFLLKWLAEYDHEHQQWSAAISLGVVSNCLHATDTMQKRKVITELLKALSNSKSHLVKGACGFGLGWACQELLSRIETDGSDHEVNSIKLTEMMLLQNIIRNLSTVLSQLCPSASDSLEDLNNIFTNEKNAFDDDFLDVLHENSDNLEEDAWGIAGLVMGLGNSVVAIYRAGAYDAVLKIKEMLISWFPQVESSVQGSVFCREMTQIPLAMGSCVALPTVMAFCLKSELVNNDFGLLVNRYGSLISELLCSKKSGILYENLLMASCIGAGLFLSCILSDGVHPMAFDDVKYLLQVLRDAYTHPYPPYVQFGGMLGVVNAFGAGAGDLTCLNPHTISFQLDNQQDTLLIKGPILSSSLCESLSTSMIQELFLVAKECRDQQIQLYSAWSISFLREKWCSKEIQNINSNGGFTDSSVPSQNFSEDSLVLNLSFWLRDIDISKVNTVIHARTVSTVLRCLSKAPRLPTLNWGAIIRRCMRYGALFSTSTEQASQLLREECICFSLAHANDASSLMIFVDELTDLSRFSTLELNLQSTLLCHLSDLLEIFSGSRLEKLIQDLVAYFTSSVYSYMSYNLEEKSSLRVSFWKGLQQCLDGTFEESIYTSNVEKCMGCLFFSLPMLPYDARSGVWLSGSTEWSEAIRCLSMAQKSWLMDFLQVSNFNLIQGIGCVEEAAKQVSMTAKLVRIGCLPISVLEQIKSYILNTRSDGMWNVLMDVAAAVSTTEGNTKNRWLLDALEISCIAEHPSTALQFIGLLSGICCKYMPLLVVDPNTVISDLPVTLASFLSQSSWGPVAESVVDKLWASTERICHWASRLARNGHVLQSQQGISDDEADRSALLARSLHQTCISLKEYLPFHKQLKLAILEFP